MGTQQPAALVQYLADYPHIRKVVLRLDNDHTGKLAAETIKTLLSKKYAVAVEIQPSPQGKRNVHIQFWLDKKEAEAFQKKVKRSGLSREAYLRHLVNGLVPQDAPPPDYYAMMRELHGIGNNLNQIAAKAHTLNALDVQRYDENCRKLDDAVKAITAAVILPKPMK